MFDNKPNQIFCTSEAGHLLPLYSYLKIPWSMIIVFISTLFIRLINNSSPVHLLPSDIVCHTHSCQKVWLNRRKWMLSPSVETCSMWFGFLITVSGEKWWCPWCSPGGHVFPKWCPSVVHAIPKCHGCFEWSHDYSAPISSPGPKMAKLAPNSPAMDRKWPEIT